ncbi:hypothetical protein E4U21_005229 [Claviceps maximensis]|nr:hypothetical protein E4U21_005229 [Claviceps maximensis]
MESSALVRELHGDLSRTYKAHSHEIERIWRSLDKSQRSECLKAGAVNGAVLRHSADGSLGHVCMIAPEMNLEDVTKPDSDFLLRHLKHRATTSLPQQYLVGVGGKKGDLEFICKMMERTGLCPAKEYSRCYTYFFRKEGYGDSIRVAPEKEEEVLARLESSLQCQLIVPQSLGEVIIARQSVILQILNILIENILKAGRDNDKGQKNAAEKTANPASQALSRLFTSGSEQPKLTTSDMIANAHEQHLSLEDEIDLMLTEPLVLAHAVNVRFLTQPELVADEKGRKDAVQTDKHISPVFFETLQDKIKGASIWSYIYHLLQHLQNPALDKACRRVVQQELVNASHMEYARVQGNFKRFVQMKSGAKWFKRISNAQDQDGNARVSLKGTNIQALVGPDTQLYCVLRLCQAETSPVKAKEWFEILSLLHRNQPAKPANLEEAEVDGLADMAAIILFIHDITCAMSLPTVSRKQGQTLTRKLQELNMRLAQVKTGVDLREFAAPIDHLLEYGMAAGALKLVDEYSLDALGATMSVAYEKLISDCLAEVVEGYEQVKTQTEQSDMEPARPCPSTKEVTGSSSSTQPRRKKGKKKKEKEDAVEAAVVDEAKDASEASVTATTTTTTTTTSLGNERPPNPPMFPVTAAAAQVFGNIFQKSEMLGSVRWDAFEAAMASLDFSFEHEFGCVMKFLPPSTSEVKKPMVIHRSHTTRIEKHRLLLIAKRLGRIYGWRGDTFQEV